MFILSLPISERSGKCRINGKSAEFQVQPGTILFRYEGESEWKQRHILDVVHDGDLAQYCCDDGPVSSGAYTIIRPTLDGDATATLTFDDWKSAVMAGILQHPAMQPGANPVTAPDFDSPILKEMWEGGATVEQIVAWADEQFNVNGW